MLATPGSATLPCPSARPTLGEGAQLSMHEDKGEGEGRSWGLGISRVARYVAYRYGDAGGINHSQGIIGRPHLDGAASAFVASSCITARKCLRASCLLCL